MERASGGSLWHIDDCESNAHDAIEVDGERVRWRIRPMGGEGEATVEAGDPAARRFVSRVLEEKRRLARRAETRPVPKPAAKRQRVRVREVVPCPLCGDVPWSGCPCCDGEGWVQPDAAVRCAGS